MALIFFKDYADVEIPKRSATPIVERTLVPFSVTARLNLQQDRFSSQFAQDTINDYLRAYKFVNPVGLPIRTWGLDTSDTNLLMVPNVVEAKTDVKTTPTPPMPEAQMDKRGKFLAYAMRSFRENMTVNTVVYDDYTFEVRLIVDCQDSMPVDEALVEFLYNPFALTLFMDIELGSISPACIQELYNKLSSAFNSDFHAIDFFEDIGESAIEGHTRLLDWAQSLINFVK